MPRVGRQPGVVDHSARPNQTLRPVSDGRQVRQGHAHSDEDLRRFGEPNVEAARRRTIAARQDEHVLGLALRAGPWHHGRTLQFGHRIATVAIRGQKGLGGGGVERFVRRR